MPYVVTICVVLLLLELLLRYRDQKTPPSVPEEVLRLREETRALCQEDVAHSVRIVAFGDSIPHGWGLSYAESYPAILERLLDESCPAHNARVINAGIPGNTVVLGWQRLERDVLCWKPHFVLVGFGLNDINLARSVFDVRREAALRRRLTPVGRIKAALRRSLLWCMVADSVKGRRRRAGVSSAVGEVSKESLPRTSRHSFQLALRDIVEHVGRHRAQAILLTMTPISGRFLGQAGGGGQLSELLTQYNAIIRGEAQRSDSLLIDLHERMSSREDVESLIDWDGVHLNAKGQQAVAQIIHEALALVL